MSGQAYADLEAYILQANGLEAGTTELTAAELGGSGAQSAPAAQQGFQGDVRPSTQAIVTQFTKP